MVAPSHAIGGLTFTALFASLHDVNILEKPYYIGLCIFLSLLPDVDLPSSAVGRMLYPLSILIASKYPHRTITHSVVALTLVSLPFYFFDSNLFIIALYSYFSHIFLDMFTLQGVQLLSPFSQAVFVLPGDREYRCSSTSIKANMTVIIISLLIFFNLKDGLFANGFWNTINSKFGTIQNARSEYVKSDNAVIGILEIKDGSHTYIDTGYMIKTESSKITYMKDSIFYTVPEGNKLLLNVKSKRSECTLTFRDTSGHFNTTQEAESFINSFAVSRLILSANYRLQLNSKKANHVSYNFDKDFPNKIKLIQLPDSKTYIPSSKTISTDTSYTNSLLRYEKYLEKRNSLIISLQSTISDEEREKYAAELERLREVSKPNQNKKNYSNETKGQYVFSPLYISVNLTYTYLF